jgi:hypothetical protein
VDENTSMGSVVNSGSGLFAVSNFYVQYYEETGESGRLISGY